jgi:hypothetical protein
LKQQTEDSSVDDLESTILSSRRTSFIAFQTFSLAVLHSHKQVKLPEEKDTSHVPPQAIISLHRFYFHLEHLVQCADIAKLSISLGK